MTNESFLQTLESKSGRKLKVRINDNHSTMLSVRWEPDQVRVSMHKMFLEAPANIMDELACYLSSKRRRKLPLAIKAFIEEGVKACDYSHLVAKKELCTKGKFHNLELLYDAVNGEYFDHQLKLSITWYGKERQKFRSRLNFGLYFDSLKLVKIHRLLDHPDVPEYVVAFIIYHEMLHALIPTKMSEKGFTIMHSKEFRQKERLFRFHDLAEEWIAKNKHIYFY